LSETSCLIILYRNEREPVKDFNETRDIGTRQYPMHDRIFTPELISGVTCRFAVVTRLLAHTGTCLFDKQTPCNHQGRSLRLLFLVQVIGRGEPFQLGVENLQGSQDQAGLFLDIRCKLLFQQADQLFHGRLGEFIVFRQVIQCTLNRDTIVINHVGKLVCRESGPQFSEEQLVKACQNT